MSLHCHCVLDTESILNQKLWTPCQSQSDNVGGCFARNDGPRFRWTVVALSLALSFTLVSCSARNIRSTTPPSHELLFPLGTYQHNVKIKTKRTLEHESQKFSFQGVVKISQDRINVVGLSPFGATLFKLSEERGTGHVEFESFIDSLKGHESKFKEYYAVLKLLLTAPHDFSESFEAMPNTKFIFKKYDKNGIPQQIMIQHPKFSIDITVTGYDI